MLRVLTLDEDYFSMKTFILRCTSWKLIGATNLLCPLRNKVAPIVLTVTAFLSIFVMLIIGLVLRPDLDSTENLATAARLKTNEKLEKLHLCILSCVIPLCFDVFLDILAMKTMRTWSVTDIRFTRAVLIGVSILPSLTHGYFIYVGGDIRYLPSVYNAATKAALVGLVCSVFVQTTFLRVAPAFLLISSAVPFSISLILKYLRLFTYFTNRSTLSSSLLTVSIVLSYLGQSSLLVFMTIWLKNLYLRYQRSRSRGTTLTIQSAELVSFYLNSVLIILSISLFLMAIIINRKSMLGRMTEEDQLWPFYVAQVFCIVPMTIVPGRIARESALVSEQLLMQKQSFVRFVSHEIRSPLAVVSAGLEIICEKLSRMEELLFRDELVELVQDTSDATETAVNILNDLLQVHFLKEVS